MIKAMRDVAEFHRAVNVPVQEIPAFPQDIPPSEAGEFYAHYSGKIGRMADELRVRAAVTGNERYVRLSLLAEEFSELVLAEVKEDLPEVADALVDMIYIICGTAHVYGIPLAKVFDEVQRANMAKAPGGKVKTRDDGKILKPEGWKPPDVAGVLREHGWKG